MCQRPFMSPQLNPRDVTNAKDWIFFNTVSKSFFCISFNCMFLYMATYSVFLEFKDNCKTYWTNLIQIRSWKCARHSITSFLTFSFEFKMWSKQCFHETIKHSYSIITKFYLSIHPAICLSFVYIHHKEQSDSLDFSKQNMAICNRVIFLDLNLISHLPTFLLGIEKTSPSSWGEPDYFEIFPSPFPPCLLFLGWITTPLPTQPLHLNAIEISYMIKSTITLT